MLKSTTFREDKPTITKTQCAKCGACAPACPVFQITGRESHTARGKLHLQNSLPPGYSSKAYSEILSLCLLCGACETACSRQIDITGLVIEARRQHPKLSGFGSIKKSLLVNILKRPGLFLDLARTGARISHLLPLLPGKSGLRFAFDLIDNHFYPPLPAVLSPSATPQAQKNATVSFFSGCLARHLYPEISQATEVILNQSGQTLHAPNDQACCGLAFHAAGKSHDAIALAKKNITAFSNNDLPILTSCASCYSHLLNYPKLFADDPEWLSRAQAFTLRLREWNTYLVTETEIPDKLSQLPATFARETGRLIYHDPCHLRFHCKITKPPRTLLAGLPGTELCELPGGPKCCGQGGLFGLLNPELSSSIFMRLKNNLDAVQATTVTTTCSGCLIKLRQGLSRDKQPVQVFHPAILLAKALFRNSRP